MVVCASEAADETNSGVATGTEAFDDHGREHVAGVFTESLVLDCLASSSGLSSDTRSGRRGSAKGAARAGVCDSDV